MLRWEARVVVVVAVAYAQEGAGAEAPASPEAAVEAAAGAFAAGDLEGALALAHDAVSRWPDAAEPRIALATWLVAAGRLDELAFVLASAPPEVAERLRPHRIVGAMLARGGAVPPDSPLHTIDLDAELAPYDAAGGTDAEFADTVRLVLAVLRRGQGGSDADVQARALALLRRPTPSPAALRAGAAGMTLVDGWDEAGAALAAARATEPEAARVLADLWLVQGLRGKDTKRVKAAGRLLAGLPDDGPALAAERQVVTLATAKLPRGSAAAAEAGRLAALRAALDPTADAAWTEALALTEASLAHARGDGAGAQAALAQVDLAHADPVAGLVLALASGAGPEALTALSVSEDEDTAALAAVWRSAGSGAAVRGWTPVATGGANVGLSIDGDGPRFEVTMTPTLVLVPVP